MNRIKAHFPSFIRSILNSYAQIFFSDHRIFAVILIVVSFFDLYAGISGLLSVVISNTAAYLIGFNTIFIKRGYYGFNSLLVGLGLGIYYQPSVEFYLLIFFTSLLTLMLAVMMEGVIGKYYLPYLSVPFLFGIWMVLLASRQFDVLDISERGIYMFNELYALGGLNLVRVYDWFVRLALPDSLEVYFRSLGAIFFQYHLFAGILIAAGLIIYSRIAFVLSLAGYYLAYLFFHIFGGDFTTLTYSYIGFNFILTSIAVGGYFIIPSRFSYLWVAILIPLTIIVIISTGTLFSIFQLSIYSLPFNIIVLLFLYILKFRQRYQKSPQLVMLQQFSPEKNLYSHLNYFSRFNPSLTVSLSLPVFGEWKVTQGHNGEHTHQHAWQHAWDFEIEDDEGRTFNRSGKSREDYYAYGKPVIAPADGWVEEIQDGIDDNPVGEIDTVHNWGNTLVLRHTDAIYTKISHLKKDSFKVKTGDKVKNGTLLALCGNSGRSPFPHVHFQVQNEPYIGAPTLDYPLSNIVHTDGNRAWLVSWDVPEKGDRVSNIARHKVLEKAFRFVPGQTLLFSVTEQGSAARQEILTVKVDSLNNQYILCERTGARAFFENQESVFYFTDYQGSKRSVLYYFFLAHFKVVKGFYQNMTIGDTLPVNLFHNRFLLFLQDLIAPFHVFIRSSYRLTYSGIENQLSSPVITLNASCETRIFRFTSGKIRFEIQVGEEGIRAFRVFRENHIMEVKCI
ncbi:MAG: urea transporter [Bacteroidales bacterium]|nr:urea transporter [Lentimicrobiaceae bacterium]MDD5694788.1 urea transporter [Bacteroidales bacterium]